MKKKPARNERTSPRVAKIAGRILKMDVIKGVEISARDESIGELVFIKWRDIRSLAASALTQTRDKARKRKRAKR